MPDSIYISSKHVLLPEGIKPATIVMSGGTISKVIQERLPATKAQPVRDYGESLIMPGLVDCNVRIDEPGAEDLEGFEYASAAAAAGGVTTIIDLPIDSSPATIDPDSLSLKLKLANERIYVNCGFWAGISTKKADKIHSLAKAGVMGFYATLETSDNKELPALSVEELKEILPSIAETGLPLIIQARISNKKANSELKFKDCYSYQEYIEKYPAQTESDSIKKILELAGKHAVKLHILDVSAAESLEHIEKSKSSNSNITAGTCLHHLFFASDTIPDQDPRYKTDPPIRDLKNNHSILEALQNGILDFVYTGHRPYAAEMKDLHAGNIQASASGITSLQFLLPIMWTIAERNKVGLEKFAQWVSERPAKFLGLEKKGSIAEGFDADLVIWSPTKKMKVNANTMRSRHKVTAYEGQMLSGVIQETWVNGQLAYDRGAFPTMNAGRILNSAL